LDKTWQHSIDNLNQYLIHSKFEIMCSDKYVFDSFLKVCLNEFQ